LKPILLGVLCFLASTFFANAQTVVLHLNIKNPASERLDNTTLQLFLLPDTILQTSKILKIGTIDLQVNKFTNYLVRISAIGLETIERRVDITDKDLTINVLLNKKPTSLQTVVVVSKKPLIKQDADKTIVDAEVLANSSTNAYEVLEKTPGAIVDQDGNVYLNSATPATIQINGREVKLSSADLASLLKSLPAGSVSKVEILRNPSAKYDAASSGGIMNIVLKKGVRLGSNGSSNASYFQGVYATESFGFNLNTNKNKFSSYLSYQFTNRNNFEVLNSSRITGMDTLLSQMAYTTYPAKNHYVGGGIDWQATNKWSLGYDVRFSGNSTSSSALNKSNIVAATQNTLVSNASQINNDGQNYYVGNNASAKYKIDSSGSEWTLQMDYTYYKNKNDQQYNNQYYQPLYPTLYGDGDVNNTKNIFVLQSDITYKLPGKNNNKKNTLTLEAGFKTTISNSKNAADYFKQNNNGPRRIDSFQTNTFRYKEAITSGYLQISRNIFGFIVKPGLRIETTDIDGRQLFPKDTSLAIKRTDLFPYLFLGHRIMKLFSFELNGSVIYRRSITRPYYESLNPYPKYVDQYLFDVGNPRLQPQFTTNYEFNIMADEFPVFSIGVNDTKDIFSNVTYQDTATKIAYRTYDNLGKSKEFYVRGVVGIPPGGKFFFYAGAQHNLVEYDGFYQGVPLAYKRGTWTFFTYQQLKVGNTTTVSINAFMRTRGLQNFYELDNFGAVTLSINKSILKKKGNVILAGNDLFKTNQINFKLDQGNVHAAGTRYNDTRKVGITFRYNFGLKPKEEKKPMFETPNMQ